MKLEKIWAVYFSGTGTTRRTVERIAGGIASRLNLPAESVDFSRPAVQQETLRFGEKDLVVFGTPVYAGRVPNVLLPFLQERIVGGGALAVPVVLFGNRNYDDALIELRNILAADGMHPIAAGAFVGEHSFSRVLGADRHNAEDEALMDEFAARVAELAAGLDAAPVKSVAVRGQEPLRPYYTPRDRAGNPINILKVKPKTDLSRCGGCGLCADLCPMGSIDPADVSAVRGICIKCCACVKGCPTGAKFFDDAGYLYHQHELEAQYARPAENEVFYIQL
ncbi:MAG: 4Fe-4S binding protein [Oscillospiraceae bacterium]|nr:4Fe-4S binding protein [Oscillospiraceae bacterium]